MNLKKPEISLSAVIGKLFFTLDQNNALLPLHQYYWNDEDLFLMWGFVYTFYHFLTIVSRVTSDLVIFFFFVQFLPMTNVRKNIPD